jgi:hypothetical protein
MTAMGSRLAVSTFALAAAVVAGGACTSILGNDFVITTGTNAGGAGVGGNGQGAMGADGPGGAGGAGGGGAGGGGGNMPPPNFVCNWVDPTPLELSRKEDESSFYSSELFMARRNADSARILVGLGSFSETEVAEVHTVSTSGTTAMTTFPCNHLYQVQRTSVQEIGALFLEEDGTGAPILKMALLRDNDPDGSNIDVEDVISSPSILPDLNTANPNIEARFAVVSGALGSPVVDITISWQTASSTYRLGYARYAWGTPITAVNQVSASEFDDDDDAQVQALIHHNSVTYAFVGESSPLGNRRFDLSPNASFPLTPEVIGDLDQFIFAYGVAPQRTRFALVDFGPPLDFLIGSIDNDSIVSFVPSDDAPVAASFDMIEDFPAFTGSPGFHGELFTMLGTPFQGGGDDPPLTYWFLDTAGNQRALGTLAISPTLPPNEVRSPGIIGGASAPVGNDFDENGGGLHVSFVEFHESPQDSSFGVLYYNGLDCALE